MIKRYAFSERRSPEFLQILCTQGRVLACTHDMGPAMPGIGIGTTSEWMHSTDRQLHTAPRAADKLHAVGGLNSASISPHVHLDGVDALCRQHPAKQVAAVVSGHARKRGGVLGLTCPRRLAPRTQGLDHWLCRALPNNGSCAARRPPRGFLRLYDPKHARLTEKLDTICDADPNPNPTLSPVPNPEADPYAQQTCISRTHCWCWSPTRRLASQRSSSAPPGSCRPCAAAEPCAEDSRLSDGPQQGAPKVMPYMWNSRGRHNPSHHRGNAASFPQSLQCDRNASYASM